MRTFLKLLFLVAMLFAGIVDVWADPLPPNPETPLTYLQTVERPGISKPQLYRTAKRWFVEAFANSNDAIQVQDTATGEITATGILHYHSKVLLGSAGTSGIVRFRVSVYVKDGKYRYEFTRFWHEGNGNYPFGLLNETPPAQAPPGSGGSKAWAARVYNDIRSQITEQLKPVITSLKANLDAPLADANW